MNYKTKINDFITTPFNKEHFMYDNQNYDAEYTITLKECILSNLDLWGGITTGLIEPLDTEFKYAFVSRYSFSEIGFSTWDAFKSKLLYKLETSHARYNKLYTLYKEQILKDPLLSQKFKTTNNINMLVSQAVEGSSLSKYNDTPQSQITAIDDGYLTSLSDIKSTNDGTTSSEGLNVVDNEGYTEQEINLLDNYRKKFIDILSVIIEDFKDLFILIY